VLQDDEKRIGMSAVKNTAVLFNPSAGGGRAQKRIATLRDHLERLGIPFDIFVTESREDLAEKTRRLAAEYPRLVGAGGDSTFFIMVNALMGIEQRPELGLIGLGSSNDIPLHFGIETIEKACLALKEGRAKSIDLGCLSRGDKITYFLGQANIGLGVSVNRYVEKLSIRAPVPGKMQGLAGLLGILRAYGKKESAVPLRIRAASGTGEEKTGQKEWNGNWTVALFSNIRNWATGKLMCPDAEADDGKLDACLIESCGLGRLIRINRLASRGALRNVPLVHAAQAESFGLSSDTPFAAQLDGEILGGAQAPEMMPQAVVYVIPSAVKLVVGTMSIP
ncbi:MAG: hypothetical protein KKB53_01230, partial [Acidobacteria bacterium]|nr:hypothetical protein [Acidobacteriota bacterium]